MGITQTPTGIWTTNGHRPHDLQARPTQADRFEEIGTSGMETWAGYIREAYHAELYWPQVFDVYNKIWRSDPEVTIIRHFFSSLVAQLDDIVFEAVDDTPESKAAVEFGNSVLAEMDGSVNRWLRQVVDYTPFFGWSWFVEVLGRREQGWRPPNFADGDDDPWRSRFNDGLIGIRRLSLRHPSSFLAWDIPDRTGRLRGMLQLDIPNPETNLPLDRSVHITFGDSHNPEGLSPLEAMWRLERYMFNLQVVYGIGSERSAGHLKFKATEELSSADHARIKSMARAVLMAQEGNFMALPSHIEADVMDVPFSAAGSLLEAIRYYSIVKLQLYNMQWVAMATTSGAGAFAAIQDASQMAITTFNAMIKGFVDQLDEQLGKRLFEKHNVGAFAGLEERPHLRAPAIDKPIDLASLGQFWQAISLTMPIDREDINAIRRKTGFLPELMEDVEMPEPKPEEPIPDDEPVAEEPTPDEEPEESEELVINTEGEVVLVQAGDPFGIIHDLQMPIPETSPLRGRFEDWERRLIAELLNEWRSRSRLVIDRLRERTKIAELQSEQADGFFNRLSQGKFWDEWENGYRQLLMVFIDEAVEMGGQDTIDELEDRFSLSVDWNLVNVDAAEWAGQHAAQLAAGLTNTDRKNIRQQLRNWVESREEFPELVGRIERVVGDFKRAELIASTESTRAYAEGNKLAHQASGLAQTDPDEIPPAHPRCRCWITLKRLPDGAWAWKWNTARDESVCPICRPLGNQRHVGLA